MNEKDTTEKTSPLASSVLSRIENEKVLPCSKWRFRAVEYGIWLFWALTVALGALSVAVMFFVSSHARFALFEATHHTTTDFVLETLPFLWMFVFGVMAVLAYINFRHTKRGYRYQVHHILLSSILFSVIGGVVLHIFGVGGYIDGQFGKSMPTYSSMEKLETRLWQDPADGRLVGTFMTMDETDTLYIFTDKEGAEWHIETAELRKRDKDLLSSGKLVRVLGTTTDALRQRFYACGVFPWMYEKGVSVAVMKEDRANFLERMYEHMEAKEEIAALEEETYGENGPMPFKKGKCAELAAVRRMPVKAQ